MSLTIVVAAVAFVRDGTVLTVRKRGTRRFMLVGGKLEPGESAYDAAVRECAEEIGIEVSQARLVGEYVTETANEPDHTLHSTVFAADLTGEPEARGEIEEIRWVGLEETGDDLAPLLVHLQPLLRAAQEDREG